MTLGKLLKELIGKQKQGAIAEEWRERWNAQSKEDVKADTAETRLSGCVNDKIDGVRFFFDARARGALLLDVLHATEPQREAVFRAADEILAASGPRPPRVVIDLGRWDAQRDAVEAIAVAIEDQILRVAELWPVVLVMTTAQFRWLPRTIEETNDRVRIEKEPDAAACEARARSLATANALVVAPWRHEPFHLWAAFSWSQGSATFSPADAIVTFARDGRLAALTPPDVSVAAIGVEPATTEKPVLPIDGVELREYMLALTSPTGALRIKKPAAQRLAVARALGIDAAATEREVIDHEIATLTKLLSMPLDERAGERGRDELIERALRRAVEPRAFRIGDEIHVVATAASIAASVREHARARLHLIEERNPAVARLRAAVSELTNDDLVEDPLLEAVIRGLDPEGREVNAFAHARATLFRTNSIVVKRAPHVSNWREILAGIVQHDPPEIALHAQGDECAIVPDGRRFRATVQELRDLPFFPSAGPVLIARDATLLATSRPEEWGYAPESETAEKDDGAGRDEWDTPRPAARGADERWQDAFESWLAHRWPRDWKAPKAHELTSTWDADLLDGMIASVWFALRRATRATEAVARADHKVQVHVGNGICLVIDARAHARRDGTSQLRVALKCTARAPSKYHDQIVLTGITQAATVSGTGSAYEPGWTTPRGVYITGMGYAMDIGFAFAPWLGRSDDAWTLTAPIRRRMDDDAAAAEEAQRQQDAYDDDD